MFCLKGLGADSEQAPEKVAEHAGSGGGSGAGPGAASGAGSGEGSGAGSGEVRKGVPEKVSEEPRCRSTFRSEVPEQVPGIPLEPSQRCSNECSEVGGVPGLFWPRARQEKVGYSLMACDIVFQHAQHVSSCWGCCLGLCVDLACFFINHRLDF